jgi:hypothetical protein
MALIVTVEQAATYFGSRLGASTYWVSGIDKTAALTTAQNQLAASYSLSASEETHRNAVCEQALMLLRNATGYDRRADLQAMGVRSQGQLPESYAEVDGIAICEYAKRVLADAALQDITTGYAGTAELTRDEDA